MAENNVTRSFILKAIDKALMKEDTLLLMLERLF
jgi:hypothetical protein